MVQITVPDDVVLFYYDDPKKGLVACPANKMKKDREYYMVTPGAEAKISRGRYFEYSAKELDKLKEGHLRGFELETPGSKEKKRLFYTDYTCPTVDENAAQQVDWIENGRVITLEKTDSGAVLAISQSQVLASSTTLIHFTKPESSVTEKWRSFLPNLRKDRENSLILSLKNNPGVIETADPDPARYTKYVKLCKSFTGAFYKENREKARKFLLIEVALLVNEQSPNEVFIKALEEYKADRLAKIDKKTGFSADYYGIFNGFFGKYSPRAVLARSCSCLENLDDRHQLAKAKAVNMMVGDLKDGNFNFDKLPVAAKNGELEDLVRFFKARYPAEDLNQKPVPVAQAKAEEKAEDETEDAGSTLSVV